MKRFFIYILVMMLFIVACEKDSIEPDDTSGLSALHFSDPPIDLEGIQAKFSKDIPYDTNEQTLFDVFLPEAEVPTGLVIFIHGGGFKGGKKEGVYSNNRSIEEIKEYLQNGIAFATISYTLLKPSGVEQEGILKCLNDSRRALQYIRFRSADFNIDKSKIILTGGSAGAGTSLWIGFHDDMKDPDNPDPVLRESTRVAGVAVTSTQATYDMVRWPDIFSDYSFTMDDVVAINGPRIPQFYGIPTIDELYTPETKAYRQQVDMLSMMSPDDPEFWAANKQLIEYPSINGLLNHHPYHVRALKRKADSVGIAHVCYYGRGEGAYNDPSGEDKIAFCVRKLNE